jgi:glycosyltransferase involved in cell wall biosynthesis
VAERDGHLGWRTDWTLLRAVAERMPELVLLLVGAWHEDECGDDGDFRWCRGAPNLVWLGRRSDEEAARLILCADVGILPFRVEPFNDAGLPYRILKYARLGRRTVSPALAGVRTWERAVTTADGPEAFAAALQEEAGRRGAPDLALRAWALEQTAAHQNAPLWARLRETGVDA